MNRKTKELLMPVLVLFLIASVMAALLGGTNLLTRERIASLAAENEKKAIAKVIAGEQYESLEIEVNGVTYPYYRALTAGQCVGYAFPVSAAGYGGNVSAMVGITAKGSVCAVEITDVSGETPGLGQNARQATFTDQFCEKNSEISVVKSNPDETQVQAITGATITSRAVASGVNQALSLYSAVLEGGAK